jgi:chemotaxis signal transduction protein
MGLLVDEVKDVVSISPDQVDAPTQIFGQEMALHTFHLTSIARLSDGLLLLLDPMTFLSVEEEQRLVQALPVDKGFIAKEG